MNTDFINSLKKIVGDAYVLTDPADTLKYNREWRNLYEGKAQVVVRPETTQQVSDIVKLCAANKIAIVPQGGNTGLVGGQVSMDENAVLLSLSRMNKIRKMDAAGFSMIAEAGVTVQTAQEEAEKANRLFALSLASEGSCEIGGTVSTNAGGMNALLYGMMRSLVFGLEVVLPDGRIWDGLRVLRKDNSGYDLKQLFIGAEGTLGIITSLTLKLY
ncbi:MAG: FAD-binding oxidoreductase, partial [Pseudomonadota bacterium]